MQFAGGLTRAEAMRQRKAILAEIEREHRRKDRERLAELREAIALAKRQWRDAMRDAVQLCRVERQAAKERAKELRRRGLEEIREAARQEKLAAREACTARKQDIRQSAASAIQKTREATRAEREFQRQIRAADRRAATKIRSTHVERRQESDDEVRSNIPPDFLALWERVKRAIKATPYMSRTEAFLKYVEEHPDELVEAMQEVSDREIRKMMIEERRLAKALRSPKRMRLTATDLADIPF